jgi:hypothetical protein
MAVSEAVSSVEFVSRVNVELELVMELIPNEVPEETSHKRLVYNA